MFDPKTDCGYCGAHGAPHTVVVGETTRRACNVTCAARLVVSRQSKGMGVGRDEAAVKEDLSSYGHTDRESSRTYAYGTAVGRPVAHYFATYS